MRTSHLALQRRIENERLKLTDEEVFASGPYSAFLTDMAEATTKRYKRRTRVRCYWDKDENAAVAFTDNRTISVNAANFLTQSFPTRQLRSDSLVGMNGHEIGHILFTDFNMLQLYVNTLRAGRMYPAEPSDLTTRESIHLAEIKEIFKEKPEVEMAVVSRAASTLTNVLEDVYIEARMCDAFPGVYRSGKGTKLELAVMFGLFYGLRRSEIVGLKWQNFDLHNATFTIAHTVTSYRLNGKTIRHAKNKTKNQSSMRSLPLIPVFVEMLTALKEQQKEDRLAFAEYYSREYQDYVYINEIGELINPNYISSEFPKLLQRHGLRHIRFHDTRHSCASLLLKNGVSMKEIQAWLGHSDYGTTANLYAHLDVDNSKLASAQRLSDGLFGISTAPNPDPQPPAPNPQPLMNDRRETPKFIPQLVVQRAI